MRRNAKCLYPVQMHHPAVVRSGDITLQDLSFRKIFAGNLYSTEIFCVVILPLLLKLVESRMTGKPWRQLLLLPAGGLGDDFSILGTLKLKKSRYRTRRLHTGAKNH